MKIKVGFFFGGRSVEHEVSIISALQAMHAVNTEKYEVIPVYITKKGVFYTGQDLMEVENYKNIDNLLAKCKKVMIVNDGEEKLLISYPIKKFGNNVITSIDVAFPVIHGTNGEDGTLQGYFESLCLPYAGCDVLSSALGMDKIFSKKLLKDAGVPVIDCLWFYSEKWLEDKDSIIEKVEKEIKYPVIVKPANTGSSVGIKRAGDREALDAAITEARCYSSKILVEKMIDNLREINCSVLGDPETARASVCEEPITSKEILTYQDKYLNNGTKGMSGATRKIPAELPEEVSSKIKELAVKSFVTLGCSGVVRIDFIIDKDTNEVYVNELNTIPGSLAFYLWEPEKVNFEQLTDEMINLALKKNREKEQLMFSYDTNLLSLQGSKMGIKK